MILKMAIGYGVIVPLAWMATWLLAILSRMRGEARQVPQNEPLDILYLRATSATGAALIGGSTAHVAGVVEGLAGLGHDVRFIANDRLLEVDHDRMPVTIVPFSPRFGSVRALFEVWNTLVFTAGALKHARARPPDLIYQRYNRFNWTGVALSTILKRPLCLEVNGLEVWVANNWDPVGQIRLLGAIERLNLRAADRVVVVSSVLARDCERSGADAGRIVVNPNGVDPERFRPGVGGEKLRRGLGLEGCVVAGFVGTFGPWHGVVTLAEAITRLPREVDVTFLLVGDGDQRSRVERILDDGGARDRVIFTGLVSHGEVAAHLDACDILLSPHVEMPDGSSFFGSPTKLFEYMAMRRPIVASRLGQIGDIVEDEVSGLLITPGAVDELNAAVTRLARDPALRDRLGRAAREKVIADYTWRRNAERVVDAVRGKQG